MTDKGNSKKESCKSPVDAEMNEGLDKLIAQTPQNISNPAQAPSNPAQQEDDVQMADETQKPPEPNETDEKEKPTKWLLFTQDLCDAFLDGKCSVEEIRALANAGQIPLTGWT